MLVGHLTMLHPEVVEPNAAPASLSISKEDARAPRIVAKSIYRLLREGGVEHRQVLSVATELLGLVTRDLRRAA
jgi:hypothetical protein